MADKIILKGKKVILRPLSLKDAPRFCQWLGDPEVTKFLNFYGQPAPTFKAEKEWIKESKKSKFSLHLAIDTKKNKHIGIVSLSRIDKKNKIAEYGIVIGDKEYWGQGYGTEACKLIIDYGFKKMKLHKIHLRHIAYNIRGHKSYKKAGFKKEGLLRQHTLRDGFWHDEVRMGLLCDEYLGKIKNKKHTSKMKNF